MQDKMKKSNSSAGYEKIPKSCIVTGGSGFVGQRLVEMLIERGCEKVISFDISPKPKDALYDSRISYIQGDITKPDIVDTVVKDIECVFHIAALVGPYHATEAFRKVNYEGSLNILNACMKHNIKRIVMSSSPSTRFPYPDPNIDGLTEDDLYRINGGHYAKQFLQPYAESKALGERAVLDACGRKETDLLAIAVAPHQVYGKRDSLFLPSLLDAAGSGWLRIFGNGNIKISMCHVDNYCHALILGYEALYEGSPALGKFYVITDDGYTYFWKILDEAIITMGFTSLWKKTKIPIWLIMLLAYLCMIVGNIYAFLTRIPRTQISCLRLAPFSVKMLTINRYFNISNAKLDLHYSPIIQFEDGWKETVLWFKIHWLPNRSKSI
jgi:nucleoside-diphosphate-sugar epimerase